MIWWIYGELCYACVIIAVYIIICIYPNKSKFMDYDKLTWLKYVCMHLPQIYLIVSLKKTCENYPFHTQSCEIT